MGFIKIRDRLKELQVLKKSLSQDSLTVKALKTKLIYLALTSHYVICVMCQTRNETEQALT